MSEMLYFLSFVLIRQTCVAVAFGSESLDRTNTVGFVEEDNQRDALSLLISCFATLLLCIYSADHLNIPPSGDRSHRILLRELKWGVIGLFTPELILYTAWRQFAAARQLRFEVWQATSRPGRACVPGEKVLRPNV
jgi:hypothetical protein